MQQALGAVFGSLPAITKAEQCSPQQRSAWLPAKEVNKLMEVRQDATNSEIETALVHVGKLLKEKLKQDDEAYWNKHVLPMASFCVLCGCFVEQVFDEGGSISVEEWGEAVCDFLRHVCNLISGMAHSVSDALLNMVTQMADNAKGDPQPLPKKMQVLVASACSIIGVGPQVKPVYEEEVYGDTDEQVPTPWKAHAVHCSEGLVITHGADEPVEGTFPHLIHSLLNSPTADQVELMEDGSAMIHTEIGTINLAFVMAGTGAAQIQAWTACDPLSVAAMAALTRCKALRTKCKNDKELREEVALVGRKLLTCCSATYVDKVLNSVEDTEITVLHLEQRKAFKMRLHNILNGYHFMLLTQALLIDKGHLQGPAVPQAIQDFMRGKRLDLEGQRVFPIAWAGLQWPAIQFPLNGGQPENAHALFTKWGLKVPTEAEFETPPGAPFCSAMLKGILQFMVGHELPAVPDLHRNSINTFKGEPVFVMTDEFPLSRAVVGSFVGGLHGAWESDVTLVEEVDANVLIEQLKAGAAGDSGIKMGYQVFD